jgi:hypothetical protein
MIKKIAGPKTAAWSEFACKSGSWSGSWIMCGAGPRADYASSCWAGMRSWSWAWRNNG